MVPMTASARLDLPPAARPTADGASPTITRLAAGMLGLLPFSTDVYLTAMVDLGRDFGVEVAGVQRTMLAFTFGFALAHLFLGRLADRYGRRPVALIGTAVYLVAAIVAITSPSLDLLVIARFVQGGAEATGPIVARTLIRDTVPSEHAGRALAKVGALFGVAPIAAPFVGTLASGFAGWRGALGTLVIYAVVLLVTLLLRLPETRPAHVHGADRVSIVKALGHFSRTRAFVVGCLAVGTGYGALYSWLTTSAFLLVGRLGYSKVEASWVYTAGAIGFLLGGMIAMRLARHMTPQRVLRIAAAAMIVGTTAPLAFVLAGAAHWAVLLVALFPYYVGWGLAQPMATAIGMRPFPEMAGQASAWIGIAQQVGGMGFAVVAAGLGGNTATLVVMVAAAVSFTVAVFLPPVRPTV
ncbi:MAG: multidrug effflux MFS transporter [Phyllobacteriaceae bacterium]|nr:multidrug effflux MFS transporter [Phyllobacteriaceae bacterium]